MGLDPSSPSTYLVPPLLFRSLSTNKLDQFINTFVIYCSTLLVTLLRTHAHIISIICYIVIILQILPNKPGTQLVVLFNSPHLCGQPSIILHPDNFLRTGSMCKEKLHTFNLVQ